jgi:hypothetical protein
VGYLQKHPGTVAGLIVRTFRAPVFHPFQDLKAPLQNSMAGTALNIRYKTDAAGIMLIFFPIQTHVAPVLKKSNSYKLTKKWFFMQYPV